MRALLLISVAALSLNIAKPAQAGEEATLADAITKGKTTLKFRLRNENVDQAGFADNANALTLRSSLKYATGSFRGFSAVVEVDNVLAFDNNYNSTINGRTDRPVIADPKFTEINQAYLAYSGMDKATFMVGRVALNMNNQRFVGTVGWRQNDQSYDLAAAIVKPTDTLTLTGAYVWNVNRIFSDKHPFGNLDTDSFWIGADYTGFSLGKLNVYGLFIDLNNPAVFGLSSQTFGARFSGKHKFGDGDMTLGYEAEFATQSDYKDSPLNYNANYYHLSASLGAHGLTGKLGYEVLGSDNGNAAFQTPLATLHKFNGWADKFLGTPAGGLEDLYASVFYTVGGQGALKGLKFGGVYHDFNADTGGNYGSEIDLLVKKGFGKHYYGALKYADYNADGFATDTKKIWVTVGAHF